MLHFSVNRFLSIGYKQQGGSGYFPGKIPNVGKINKFYGDAIFFVSLYDCGFLQAVNSESV